MRQGSSWRTRTTGLRGPSFVLGCLLALILSVTARAQSVPTPSGTLITNTATVRFDRAPGLSDTRPSNTVTTTVVPGRSTAQLAFLRVAGSAGAGVQTSVAPTVCRTAGGALNVLPAPTLLSGTTLVLNQPQGVVTESVYHGGEPVLVRVTEADRNLDATKLDTLEVTIASPDTGDRETIVLTETGVNTGIFAGYLPTAVGPATKGDCVLEVARASHVDARYADVADPTDVALASARIDPQGTVFDSASGQAVSGAVIRLVDATTGAPASVLGDDGKSSYPSVVTSGATVTDSGGTLYQFPAGTFRFPLLARPGSYRLVVDPPAGHVYPSTVSTATLQALPGAPFTLGDGSFGRAYTVASPAAVTLDVPLDPGSGSLVVTLTTSAQTAAIGDAVEYTVTLRNVGTGPARAVSLVNALPPGLRYVKGSTRSGDPLVKGALADPTFDASGRQLTYLPGDLAPGATVTLRFVARLGAGTPVGLARAIATATSVGVVSNTAEASVLVSNDLFSDRGFLLGRVTDGNCAAAGAGVAGVRIYLEDGHAAVTDSEGRYHFEDLTGGSHVAQIDTATLPPGSTPVACDGRASQRDGRARLVDLRTGALARADFVVHVPAGSLLAAGALSGAPSSDTARAVDLEVLERLPAIESMIAGRQLLLPTSGFNPAIPAMHIAVKHGLGEVVEATINGVPVPALTRDHALKDDRRQIAVSRWRGVPLVEGDNRLVAVVRDAAGAEVARFERSIHYGGAAVRAEIDPAKSVLVADGRTRPVLAVRLYDRFGQPARPGTQGGFRIEAPYRAFQDVSTQQAEALMATSPREPTYVVGSDGLAHIELAPTSDAGTAVVRLRFGPRNEQELRAWLEPVGRDFILVGLAEGTAGYRKLTENAEALPPGAPAEGYEGDGRVAFFAKGQVLGSYLLTVAYDSDRDRTALDRRLQGVVDPHQYYTLYGDASEMRQEAPSQRKVYVKLERRAFVALFGDFDTGFTVTELARYSRRMNGVRIESASGPVHAIAFAAQSPDQAGRDVIPGDGTSGPYRLGASGLVAGGDNLRIEIRDRFRSEVVVSSTPLARYLDYDIDYVRGTVFLRHPLPSRDDALNPVYLVAEYEVVGNGAEHTTLGGRATTQLLDGKVEAGATYVREGASAGERQLGAVDVKARVGSATLVRAELARSENQDPAAAGRASAYLVDVTSAASKADGHAYVREQGAGFGVGQESLTETATRKLGVEGRLRLEGDWSLRGQAYEQKALDRDADRRLAEAEAHYEQGTRSAGVGVRDVKDERDGVATGSEQIYANVRRDVLEGRVVLKGTVEQGLPGQNTSADFPDRIKVGADYRLMPGYTLFASDEASHGTQLSGNLARVGVKAEPWKGSQLETAMNAEGSENGARLFSNVGLAQGWRPSQAYAFDVGLERAATLHGVAPTPITGPMFGTTPASDFTAAFAGATVHTGVWTWVSRLEHRSGDTDTRSIASLGGYREPKAGQAFSLALRYIKDEALNGRTTSADTRLSWAYRPADSKVMALDRLDFLYDSSLNLESLRVVNNAHLNWLVDARTQLGLQWGARLAHQTLTGEGYRGYTGLYGADLRRDLDGAWDIGVQGTVFDTPAAATRQYSAGIDVGRRFGQQLWVSVGFNLVGFSDRDFSADRYTARGVYVRFRVHVDQDSMRDLLDGFRAGNRR